MLYDTISELILYRVQIGLEMNVVFTIKKVEAKKGGRGKSSFLVADPPPIYWFLIRTTISNNSSSHTL
jgi:hypothetical protein